MSVESLLTRIAEILEANFPTGKDVEVYFTSTETVPANSTFTLTVEVPRNWKVKIKEVYADAAPDCTYEWHLIHWSVVGNEYAFVRGVDMEELQRITLKVTNAGAAAQKVDVYIKGWGRKLG